jgi:hypothetical protein
MRVIGPKLTSGLVSAQMTAGFGAATLLALLFLMEDIPIVRRDILTKIPIVGSYWEHTVPPEDNPF